MISRTTLSHIWDCCIFGWRKAFSISAPIPMARPFQTMWVLASPPPRSSATITTRRQRPRRHSLYRANGLTDHCGRFDAKALYQQLEDAFEQSAFRANNVSQVLACIEVQSPEVRALLLKGCALDLHPSRFPPGRCARPRFAALPTVLHCTGPTNFECVVTSSHQDYLLSWLADAAEEVLDPRYV